MTSPTVLADVTVEVDMRVLNGYTVGDDWGVDDVDDDGDEEGAVDEDTGPLVGSDLGIVDGNDVVVDSDDIIVVVDGVVVVVVGVSLSSPSQTYEYIWSQPMPHQYP